MKITIQAGWEVYNDGAHLFIGNRRVGSISKSKKAQVQNGATWLSLPDFPPDSWCKCDSPETAILDIKETMDNFFKDIHPYIEIAWPDDPEVTK